MPDSALLRAVALLCGAYSILLLTVVPANLLLAAVACAAVASLAIRPLRLVGFFLLGFCSMALSARAVIDDQLEGGQGGDLRAEFRIIEFPDADASVARLVVEPIVSTDTLPRRIRLTWFDPAETPRLGDCWAFSVRLRRPRGSSNPGTFDYAAWLFRESIGATGYVRAGAERVPCVAGDALTTLRRQRLARLERALPKDAAGAVVQAISLGARHAISDDQWQRYAVTGTSHLIAISGMHIGLAAGCGFGIALLFFGCTRRDGNHRVAASLLALALAASYVALSGFAVPARRAIVMLAIGVLAVIMRRGTSAWQILGLSCLIVALSDPLQILSPGFKLSFGAVVVLVLRCRMLRPAAGQRTLCRRLARNVHQLTVLQLALLVGLLPLTAVLFGRASWVSPAVNLLVIPVFNIVTVPAALAGAALPDRFEQLAEALLVLSWSSVRLINRVVDLASSIPAAELHIADLTGTGLPIALLTMAWLLLPAGWPGRPIAWIAAVATVLHAPPRPPQDCADLHILDVGQGLAVVITTQNRTAIYDTGPAFRSGANAGSFVVVPFLRSLRVRNVDLLIVSHADLDHAGGVAAVTGELRIGAILAGERLQSARAPQFSCRSGQTWSWDGVRFTVIYPAEPRMSEGNNASCVLEIAAGAHRALLTGDIEALAERQLLSGRLLSPQDLVVIPHHGSATSSSQAFVEALRPGAAVASAGFANRWNMPRAEIVERWIDAGATVYDTASDGALSYRLCTTTGLELKRRNRRDSQQIWSSPEP